jgi:RNA polymerase sigma factor (sigma-70 family)
MMVVTETSPDDLLLRFQAGDKGALDRLWTVCLPRLRRWARGRFQTCDQEGVTVEDLVQEAFVKALPGLRTFRPRGPGAFVGYLRTIVLNQIRDHARRSARRPRIDVSALEAHVHPGPSPLEQVLGRELRVRYERALACLSAQDRQMVVAFVELRCSDQELAARFAKPSRDAARVARNRAVARLAVAMA